MPRSSANANAHPVSSGEAEVFIKLALAILIDLVGLLTYLVPGLGESGDVLWAPLSGWLIYWLFGRGDVAVLGFAEEVC